MSRFKMIRCNVVNNQGAGVLIRKDIEDGHKELNSDENRHKSDDTLIIQDCRIGAARIITYISCIRVAA